MKALEKLADNAAIAGATYSIIEIIACLTLGKALNRMWILVCATQFIVYMGVWLIQYPEALRFLLYELKRATLGEIIDDLKVGEYIEEKYSLCDRQEPKDATQ